MKKVLSRELTVCDYCLEEGKDVDAMGKSEPSKKDVCTQHYNAFLEEVRLPKEMNDEMSGLKVPVDPGFKAKMIIKYIEE